MVRNPTLAALGLVVLAPFAPQGLPPFAGEADSAVQRVAQRPMAFAGIVFDRHGAPVEGAVVVSSAGGRAVSDRSGSYRLEVDVPLDARSVAITAVGAEDGCTASTMVDISGGPELAWVPSLELALGVACRPSWLPTFGSGPGTSDTIIAVAVFDDGSGPALHVAGNFESAGGAFASGLAKWDGANWTAVGGQVSDVRALLAFDDGSGPALYAGGSFHSIGGVAADNIARWDGSSWTKLGMGMNSPVEALAVFNDGDGPAVYAGGYFTIAGSVSARHVAKWTGSNWRALGNGTGNGSVHALTAFDDGNGPALYAGGTFTTAGSVAANRVAKWDGVSWTALGNGVSNWVEALAVFDDGRGPALYVGGNFSSAGGVGASQIARWDGSSWSKVGSGLSPFGSFGVSALTTFDDGSGPALYAGGDFVTAAGVTVNRIARWDGSSWSALGNGVNLWVFALTVFDDGSGPALFAAGAFDESSGIETNHIAKWQHSSWTGLGESGIGGPVNALETFDDGRGRALYAGGSFQTVPGVAANHIARWDGSSWEALSSGLNDEVLALSVFDAGSGPALHAGGAFTTAGGGAASFVASWDGASWSALDAGLLGISHDVQALTVFDDGAGPALYAGGQFQTAGGGHIARWDGASWVAVGGGVVGQVQALEVFDDGSGPALYAGGLFSSAGGVTANRIAKWNGTSWTALGNGLSAGVRALQAFDDGSGMALYAGGDFAAAGGVSASAIARWDGSSWSALGGGMASPPRYVMALSVFDDGCGAALYAGGRFATAGGVAASNIARWDGSSWTTLGGGMGTAGTGILGTQVRALTTFNDGGGPALHAGGNYLVTDSRDRYLAKWSSTDTIVPVVSDPSPHRR